ncbi:hypothetical protein ACDP63_11315 [Paracoccus sp. P2]|uniref:hypothetical protein n=1 Tax=Paracoccus sp. P2 TaxID=3248840 RepID=UPI00391F8A8E
MSDIQPVRQAIKVLDQRVTEIERAGSPDELEAAWIGVLNAYYSFFEKCKAISKSESKSGRWFEGKVHARRTDPLLAYMHHARNAETHGLEGSQKWDSGTLLLGIPGMGASESMTINLSFDHRGIPTGTVRSNDGRPITGYHAPARMYLVDVIDKGTSFPVPTEHLGKPLSSTDPLLLSKLVQTYLRTMLEELTALHE